MDYILGLDLGIGSIGYALVGDKKIIDLGVRIFSKAETDKDGKSLNLIRRQSRLGRRRIFRRAERLKKLLNFLIAEKLIARKEDIFTNKKGVSPWELRARALNSPLTKNELARVIYHICKHRGFYWTNSSELTTDDNGKIKESLSANQELLKAKGYLTIGQMIVCENSDNLRNKRGSYANSISRIDLDSELRIIFKSQKEFGSEFINDNLVQAICGSGDRKTGFLWMQKPALSGEKLLEMVGRCRFESSEKRAPKNSFLAEKHVWLTKLLNLKVRDELMEVRRLNKEEFEIVKSLPYENISGVTYKKISESLVNKGLWKKNEYYFVDLDYKQNEKDKKKDPLSSIFHEIKGWHNLSSLISKADANYWKEIKEEISKGNTDLYDFIVLTLTVYKEDEDVIKRFKQSNIPEKVVNALLSIRFKEFSALSTKALSKIVTLMDNYLRYDEACATAGYKHYFSSQDAVKKGKYLPPLYKGRDKNGTMLFNEDIQNIPRNPVVLRTINQTRKVVNAIIKKYGSPTSVHIELARDLSKPFEERKKIEKEQSDNYKNKLELIQKFKDSCNGICNGKNLEKYRLYEEQNCKSIYSGKIIDIQRLFEPGYVEIDHILPYSRSYDDSQSNKVLVLSAENQNKGNQTPYEYITGINGDWNDFVGRVKRCNFKNKRKIEKLLTKTFAKREGEFKERNLNDTRYICRFVKNYIDMYLKLKNDNVNDRCVVVCGAITSLLRKKWGLIKNRSENDRHHALDAVVIACCTRSMIQAIGTYFRSHEVNFKKNSLRFPIPWECFRNELLARLSEDDKDKLLETIKGINPNITDEDLYVIRPLFVSRMCEKIGKGALHKDTVRRQNDEQRKESIAVSKINLTDIKIEDITKNLLVDYERNKKLYECIKNRIIKFYIKSNKTTEEIKKQIKKEFTENPLHMPGKDGIENKNNPIVYSVRKIEKLTGIPVRNGVAGNGDMIRTDIFRKNKKYYLIPVYSWHKELPNKAVTRGKNINDWITVDSSYEWCFSLYRNEPIKVCVKNKEYFGYYAGLDISTGAISILLHDRQSKEKIKKGLIREIGVKSAEVFEKYRVDVLGNIYKAQKENRRDLA